MGDDGVSDRGRVETQLLQPAGDFFFDGIVEERIDQDDAVRRRHGPRGVLASGRRSRGCRTPSRARHTRSIDLVVRLRFRGRRPRTATRRRARPSGRAGHGAEEVEQILIRVARRGLRDATCASGVVAFWPASTATLISTPITIFMRPTSSHGPAKSRTLRECYHRRVMVERILALAAHRLALCLTVCWTLDGSSASLRRDRPPGSSR